MNYAQYNGLRYRPNSDYINEYGVHTFDKDDEDDVLEIVFHLRNSNFTMKVIKGNPDKYDQEKVFSLDNVIQGFIVKAWILVSSNIATEKELLELDNILNTL